MWDDFAAVRCSDRFAHLREKVDQSVVPSGLFGVPAKFGSENGRGLICTTSGPGDADAIDCYGADVEYQEWPVYSKCLYCWLLVFYFRKVKLNVPVSFL